ncbi:hypothetical protein ACF044_10910 [Microbacterium sp. NPDC016588]
MTYEVCFVDADQEAWSTEADADELAPVIAAKIARGCVITSVTPHA